LIFFSRKKKDYNLEITQTLKEKKRGVRGMESPSSLSFYQAAIIENQWNRLENTLY
jgi:hypothetical protein